MKRNLTISMCVLLISIVSASYSQIPNSGFEAWEDLGAGLVPVGWNAVFNDPDYPTVLPSNDAYSGTKSCLLQTIFNPMYGEVIGPLMVVNEDFPVSGTPQSLTGYLKGTSSGNDSLIVEVNLLDAEWNTLAFGIRAFYPGTGWTQFSVPLTYYVMGTPAFGHILISCSPLPHDGTQFYVDQLEFGGGGNPTAPLMLFGSTNNDGSMVSLGFDKEMADPTGNEANFTFPGQSGITVTSLNLKQGNPNIIELYVNPTFQEEDDILMDYTPGTIQSFQGIALAAYTNFPIANNVGGGGGTYLWQLATSGTNKDLRDVRFADNNTGWAVGNEGTTLKSSNSGISWMSQTTSAFVDLRSIWTFDPNKVMISAWDTLYSTNNGGANWSQIWTNSVNINITDIFFVNQNLGYIIGEWSYYAKTTDGGNNWTGGITVSSEDFKSVYFTTEDKGYTVGTAGMYAYTNNGGELWKDTLIGTQYTNHSIFFTSAQVGWIAGNVHTLMKTADAGLSWQEVSIPGMGNEDHFYCIYFVNANTGWISGSNGLILKTTDGGQNWQQETTPTTHDLYSVHFTDADHGWAVGEAGTILRYGPETAAVGENQPVDYFEVNIYPNPTQGNFKINLKLEYSLSLKIQVLDIAGRVIHESPYQEYQAGVNEVNTWPGNIPAGLYFLAIYDQQGNNTIRKIIVN